MNALYTFGPFRLDPAARTLARGGQLIALTAREFDILHELAKRMGEPVSKEVFAREVWNGVFVDENNLAQHVRRIRQKLGKDAQGEQFIRTLQNRGYYLVAAPQFAFPDAASGTDETVTASPVERQIAESPRADVPADRSRRWLPVAAVITGIAVAVVAFPALRNSLGSFGSQRPTVAVMQFQNGSLDSALNGLSSAIPLMLRTEIGAAKEVRIISGEEVARATTELRLPPSDAFARDTLRPIRQTIGADYVLIGSFTRSAGQEIRLDLKLQDTGTGETVLSYAVRGPVESLFDLIANCGVEVRSHLGAGSLFGFGDYRSAGGAADQH